MNKFTDVLVEMIRETPGLTAWDYAKIALAGGIVVTDPRGVVVRSLQDAATILANALYHAVRGGEEHRVYGKDSGGYVRYYPTTMSKQTAGSATAEHIPDHGVPPGRGENWETTVVRALDALGGEAPLVDIMRWVQDDRPRLTNGWQTRVGAALRENADAKGKGLFHPVPNRPSTWRLVGHTQVSISTSRSEAPSVSPRVIAQIEGQVRTLGKLVARALDPVDDSLTPLEHHLLGIVAYKLGWYREAVGLFDQATASELGATYRTEAEQMRQICSLKLES